MHASGMNGMNPSFFMSVLPSKECDRNPGVHEDRVDQPVKINLRRNFDLQKNDERDDGLNESDDGPELLRHEHIVVEDDCEAGIEHIDICHHQVERGEDEEIVLQKLHDAVKDDNAVPFDAFSEKDGNVPFRAVELALGPPLSLAA